MVKDEDVLNFDENIIHRKSSLFQAKNIDKDDKNYFAYGPTIMKMLSKFYNHSAHFIA